MSVEEEIGMRENADRSVTALMSQLSVGWLVGFQCTITIVLGIVCLAFFFFVFFLFLFFCSFSLAVISAFPVGSS